MLTKTADSEKLNRAAGDGDIDMMQSLIKAGADVNVADEEGQTPLHLAVINEKHDAIEFLMGQGADPVKTNANGDSPRDMAKDRNDFIATMILFGAQSVKSEDKDNPETAVKPDIDEAEAEPHEVIDLQDPYGRARFYDRMGKYEMAIKALLTELPKRLGQKSIKRLLVKDRHGTIAMLDLLGICYSKNRQSEKAQQVFEMLCAINPESASSYLMNAGNSACEVADFDKGLEYFHKANQLMPDNPMIHNNLGRCCFEIRDFQSAADCFKKAARLGYEDPEFHVNLAACYAELGMAKESMEMLQAHLKDTPDDVDALNNLAVRYAEQRMFNDAFEIFRKLVEMEPEDIGFLNNMGCICLDMGMKNEARQYFEKALEIDPDNEDLRYNLDLLDDPDGDDFKGFILFTAILGYLRGRQRKRRQ